MLNGLMMDDFQLSLTVLVERAERLSSASPVVSRRPDGSVRRLSLGDCAQRARRLASGLADLGIEDGDRVATLLWNQTEHLELYFAVPAMGAVIHTLNPRLSPDDLSYIAADAEDRIVVVDESLIHVLDSIDYDFEQVIVVSDSGSSPAGAIEYESLIAESEPLSWPVIDERQAAAMCYTSGTTGRPKGVIYSHRALVLHSLVFALPDALGNQLTRRDPAGSPDVPRQRLEPAVHGRLDGREVGAARASPGSRQFAGPARGRARDVHGRGADGVDGGPAGTRC